MSDIETWAETGFSNLTPEQLREAGSALGLSFGPNTKPETMREKLCVAVGQAPPAATVTAPVVTKLERKSIFEPKPNLSASGTWGGRRYDVLIFKGQDAQDTKATNWPARWEDAVYRIPYDRRVSIPEPFYHALVNGKGNKITNEQVTHPDGRIEILHNSIPFQTVTFQNFGVTPGTDGLPGSKREYWQRQAERTGYFRPDGKLVPRKTLIAIRADLYDPQGAAFYKDKSDDDLWTDIMQFLGYEELMDDAA